MTSGTWCTSCPRPSWSPRRPRTWRPRFAGPPGKAAGSRPRGGGTRCSAAPRRATASWPTWDGSGPFTLSSATGWWSTPGRPGARWSRPRCPTGAPRPCSPTTSTCRSAARWRSAASAARPRDWVWRPFGSFGADAGPPVPAVLPRPGDDAGRPAAAGPRAAVRGRAGGGAGRPDRRLDVPARPHNAAPRGPAGRHRAARRPVRRPAQGAAEHAALPRLLTRFTALEQLLRSNGQWWFPHPWLATFVGDAAVESVVGGELADLPPADLGPLGQVVLSPILREPVRSPLLGCRQIPCATPSTCSGSQRPTKPARRGGS